MTTSALVTPHPLAHPPYITTLALSCSIFPPKHSINFPDIYHISSSTLSCYSPVAPIIRCWVSSHFTWCSLNISSIIHLKYIPVPSLAPYHHHDRHCSPHIWSTSQPPRLLWHFYYVQPLYYAPLSGKFHLSSIFPTQLTLIFTARKTVTIMLAFMRLPTRTDYTRKFIKHLLLPSPEIYIKHKSILTSFSTCCHRSLHIETTFTLYEFVSSVYYGYVLHLTIWEVSTFTLISDRANLPP